MNMRCFEPEELDDLVAVEPGDPRLLHAEDCPRCRGRLAAYRRFMSPAEAPAGVDLAGAEARMREALRRELAGSAARDGTAGEGLADRMSRWLAAWGRRPVVTVAAALAIVAASVLMLSRLPEPGGPAGPGRGVLRGTGDARGSLAEIALLPVRTASEGAIELRWRAVPGAAGYEVRLATTGFDPAGHWTLRDTFLVVRPGTAAGALLYWQVTALRDGRALAESAPGTLRVP